MKTWVRKSLNVGVLSAGMILLAGGTAAQAADLNTSDNDGALTGNQILADIDIPIDVHGNAVGVLGDAAAMSSHGGGGAARSHAVEAANTGGHSGLGTGGHSGLGTGNQILADVDVPILACGNAVGVLGDAAAGCKIDDKQGPGGYGSGHGARGAEAWKTSNNDGLLTGNQILADVDVPILACGNAIAVAGDSAAACGISGGGGGDSEGIGSWRTVDNDGLLTGNQILADVDVPILACGNAVGVLGDAAAACGAKAPGEGPGEEPGEPTEPDEPSEPSEPSDGYGEEERGSGAEVLPVFSSLTGLTQLTQSLPTSNNVARHAEAGRSAKAGSWRTADNDGLLTGNQILADVDIPVNITGNAVGVAGDALAVSR
jgi:hypothetical protein